MNPPHSTNTPPSGRPQGNPRADSPAAGIDYRHFLQCVHCGLCTSSCPTYTELGDENDGPRGRIHLMRAVADGRLEVGTRLEKHLALCLDCRACETACPSGVEYGRIIEPFRLALEENPAHPWRRWDWFRQIVLWRIFPYANRLRAALLPVRAAQWLGVMTLAERLRLTRLIPGRMGRMVSLLPPRLGGAPRLPKFLPAVGRRRARVAFFVGCAADALFRHTHWATLRVLQQNGCDIVIPRGQGCCGAIRLHSGDGDGARRDADVNATAFDLADIDAVIVNHAGCGAMIKEYPHHWDDPRRPERARFAGRVRDINEFLDQLGPVPPPGRIEAVATYHDACHLRHAQRISDAPRRLLAMIPGLTLRDLPETEICCGSAGTYNLLEGEMADRLSRRKVENILSTGARIVLASNAGCLLQIAREVRLQRQPLRVMHPMDLLDLSYRGESL